MHTAKLFANGRSQAVRLPKEYAFSGKEVYIKKLGGVVVLIPKDDPWKPFLDSLGKFSDDFMSSGRDQGASPPNVLINETPLPPCGPRLRDRCR